MSAHTTLLQPIRLSPQHELRNRIVMPPLVIWKADESAEVTDAHRNHYTASAPGCGMVVVEATTVVPEGRLAATQLGIFDDRHVDGLASLSEIISKAGALPGIQLHTAGGRTNKTRTYGAAPRVPTVLPGREDEVQELSAGDIAQLIDAFVAGAKRAVAAGFRLLEIHGAHGYLGSQFLCPRYNLREDEWGGAPGVGSGLSGRLRFLRTVVEAIRGSVPSDVLVSCRLGVAEGDAPFAGVVDPDHADEVAAARPPLTIEEGVQAARELEAAGLDLIHVSHAGSVPQAIDPDSPLDPTLQLSKPVSAAVSIPVIAVGGVKTPEIAETALSNGYADLVAVGRGILADPNWARKVADDRADAIGRCIDCKPRCFHFTDTNRCPTRKRLGVGAIGEGPDAG